MSPSWISLKKTGGCETTVGTSCQKCKLLFFSLQTICCGSAQACTSGAEGMPEGEGASRCVELGHVDRASLVARLQLALLELGRLAVREQTAVGGRAWMHYKVVFVV